MMEWLVKNWTLLALLICVCIGIYMTIRKYYFLPKPEQIAAIKQWLLYAVIEAEKEFGSGTGKLKLRQVYDAFVTKFPWAAQVVSFDLFSVWVDEVLIEMRELLTSNEALKTYVNDERW